MEDVKRCRDFNWSALEKEVLRECINNRIKIIEHKGNDTSMIAKKKDAWKAVREGMLAAGYDRDIKKLKQQWVRMKLSTRKAVSEIKRASVATGNFVPVPKLGEEDNIVHGMIAAEFLEDDILMDSDTVGQHISVATEVDQDGLDSDLPNLLSKSINENSQTSGNYDSNNEMEINQEKTNDVPHSYSNRLRNLPKNSAKRNVIEERQRQIAKESLYSKELHLLQKKHLEEMHSLNLELVREQIRHAKIQNSQEEELHSLKLELIRKKIHSHDLACQPSISKSKSIISRYCFKAIYKNVAS